MINIPGVISVILFYIVILLVGIWAGRKKKTATIEDEDNENFETEEVMLAGRNIGLFVGIFTMTGEPFESLFFSNVSLPLSCLTHQLAGALRPTIALILRLTMKSGEIFVSLERCSSIEKLFLFETREV